MRTIIFVVLLALVGGGVEASGKSTVQLEDRRPLAQRTRTGESSSPVRWAGKRWTIGWKKYAIGGTTLWHPRLLTLEPKARVERVLFEASNENSVYWGAPLRIVWFPRGDELLIRLVEINRIGGPAYAACLLVAMKKGLARLERSAQPGRDGRCPRWASPVVRALARTAQ